MLQREEILELTGVIAREFPHIADPDVKAAKLVKMARKLHRYGIKECNEGELNKRELADVEKMNKEAKAIIEGEFKTEFREMEDPRGYPIMMILPSRRSNSFAGQVWGIGYL